MVSSVGTTERPETLLICCGALAREVITLARDNGWSNMHVQCLPAAFHNDPDRIVQEVRMKIHKNRGQFDQLLVLYSDCGTGGGLQQMLDEEGVEGIGGAHCYEVFAGTSFAEMLAEEPGCFFVTDFLARNFERLVFRGLGLDRFPTLRESYFGNYKKLVYLAQTRDPELRAKAEAAAESVGLDFEVRYTAHGGYDSFLRARQDRSEIPLAIEELPSQWHEEMIEEPLPKAPQFDRTGH